MPCLSRTRGMGYCGLAPRCILVLIATWAFKCGSSTCPLLAPSGASAAPKVVVSNDTAFLQALQNQSVRSISLINDMTLGPSWASLAAPVTILRNLTISGASSSGAGSVSVNLGSLSKLLVLGPSVLLQFSALVLMQDGPKLLDPGLQIIGGLDVNATLQLTAVQMSEECCYPSTMWDRFVKDNLLSYASVSPDTTFVCDKYGNCYDQQVTFGDLCSSENSSLDSAPNYLPYSVRWSQVTMLCESSITADCILHNSSAACLAQCYATGRHTVAPPAAVIVPTPPSPDNQEGVKVQTIVLATVIPAVALAAAVAGAAYLWLKHTAWQQERGASSTDIWKGGPRLFGNKLGDIEAGGDKSARSRNNPAVGVSLKSSMSPAGILGAGREEQLSSSGGRPVAAAARGRSEDIAGRDSGPAAADLPRGGSGPGSASAGSGVLPATQRSPQPFNAAEAVASLAASREQRGLAGDGDLMDLQRRVQQLAEQRLISEDEKLVLGRAIGRGAFGIVFHGLWRNLDVAVKTMLFSQNDGARQESALIEAALASSVVHPNVVSVYHFDMKPITVNPGSDGNPESLHVEYEGGQTDWKMYIVQELCQSSLAETLETWVFHDQQTGQPRMDLILSVLLDVACGCAHIHSKNIIWGDLKPGNVMLKMDPSKPHGVIAKITDFGMSTTIDPSLSHISNYNKGTPFYVAPEILMSQQATKTSDVFSFGILIQQMLTRSTPYYCTPSGAVEVNKQFWRPTPGSCPSLTDVRRRCLDQNPKNRPKFEEIFLMLQEAYESSLGNMPVGQLNLAGGPEPTMLDASAGDVQPHASAAAEHQHQHQHQPETRQQQAPGECEAAATSERRVMKDALAAQSVPGRSASSTIADVTSQLTGPQSRLFNNWPMSDGALQGMQMLEPTQSAAGRQPRNPLDLTSEAHSSSNVSSSPFHLADATVKDTVQQELFPNWSTQF